MSKLRRKFRDKLEQKQNIPYVIPGLLGNTVGVVKVPNRNNYVYVRLAGAGVAEVFNNRVNTIFDLPVICGYDPVDPQRFQVLSLQGATADAVGSSIIYGSGYAPSERYRWMYPGGGQDPLFSELRQLMPLRITPTGGMKFIVHNQVIFTGTTWEIFGGSTEIDLTSLIPTTSGKCCMVLISIDENGDIETTKGSEVNIADLVASDIPAPPAGTRYVLGAIRLYYGQTQIQEARTNTDVVDLRFPQITSDNGASTISDLTDVDLTGLDDDDVLVYDSVSGTWIPETPSGGSPLTVEEIDGTPSVNNVTTINVTNGSLTDEGSGVITLDFGSAATDGSAIHDNEANEISAITEKTTPHDDDIFLIEDSEASYVKKKVKASNLPSGGADIGARVYHNADQTIPHASTTTLAFNSERYDTDSIHDNTTNNSRLTCKTAGKYIISLSVEFIASVAGIRQIRIRLNGSTNICFDLRNPPSAECRMTITTVYNLSVNDYVEALVNQTSGSNLDIKTFGNWSPEFMMQKIG